MFIENLMQFSNADNVSYSKQAKYEEKPVDENIFNDKDTESSTDEKSLSGFRRFLKFKESSREKMYEKQMDEMEIYKAGIEKQMDEMEIYKAGIEKQMDSQVQYSEIKFR